MRGLGHAAHMHMHACIMLARYHWMRGCRRRRFACTVFFLWPAAHMTGLQLNKCAPRVHLRVHGPCGWGTSGRGAGAFSPGPRASWAPSAKGCSAAHCRACGCAGTFAVHPGLRRRPAPAPSASTQRPGMNGDVNACVLCRGTMACAVAVLSCHAMHGPRPVVAHAWWLRLRGRCSCMAGGTWQTELLHATGSLGTADGPGLYACQQKSTIVFPCTAVVDGTCA